MHETSKKRREETKIREILNLESIIIRIALVMLFFALWLVKKTRTIYTLNQMQN